MQLGIPYNSQYSDTLPKSLIWIIDFSSFLDKLCYMITLTISKENFSSVSDLYDFYFFLLSDYNGLDLQHMKE